MTVSYETDGLRVDADGAGWRLAGPGSVRFALVNDYLAYLADRRYSPRTVRSYAFDLLHFCRWLVTDGTALDAVATDTLLRFLAACREEVLPGQHGGNVVSLRTGRTAGYAAATVNRRLAAISGLFAFRAMRDPAAPNPVPRGTAARRTAKGERSGMLGHLARPRARSLLRLREPRRLPRGLDREETRALLASFRCDRDRAVAGLMLFSGLRSAEVLGLQVADFDVGRGWVRVTGKGGKERRVPVDPEVAGLIQSYLLAERPQNLVAGVVRRGQGTAPRPAAQRGGAAPGVPLPSRQGGGSGRAPARAAPHVRHRFGGGRGRLAGHAGADGP